MRNFVIGLAVVALVGLASSAALAKGPATVKDLDNLPLAKAVDNPVQLAHGPRGVYYGWRRPYVYGPRVVAPAPVVVRPRVVYPYSSYYYGYPYYYGPTRSFQYYGSGVGVSVGW